VKSRGAARARKQSALVRTQPVEVLGRATGQLQVCKGCGGARFSLEVDHPPGGMGIRIACLYCADCGARAAMVGMMSIGQDWKGIAPAPGAAATGERREEEEA
jgi:hypothetical protein